MEVIEENKVEINFDNYQIIKDFHSVKFVREIRDKISSEIQDKKLDELIQYFENEDITKNLVTK